MVGTGQGRLHGILIKSAEALETAHSVDTVVLDKTGTITAGTPQVTDVIPAPGLTPEELLQIGASLEKPSEHPLAEAIVAEANRAGLELAPVEEFLAVPGRGIQARLGGQTYLAGNLAFMQEQGVNLGEFEAKADELAEQGKTPMYFADTRRILGLIAAADLVKPSSLGPSRSCSSWGWMWSCSPGITDAQPRPSARSWDCAWCAPKCCRKIKSGKSTACRSRAKRWPWWVTV